MDTLLSQQRQPTSSANRGTRCVTTLKTNYHQRSQQRYNQLKRRHRIAGSLTPLDPLNDYRGAIGVEIAQTRHFDAKSDNSRKKDRDKPEKQDTKDVAQEV